ncbi:MAG TPA: hypothetical protein VMM18_03890 [Gemmatimonadaceae bacterium]|nr:hypothetical protein [Gemmatimonadaceae bacterium]
MRAPSFAPIAVLLAATLACDSGSPPPAVADESDPSALCMGIANTFECARRVEEHSLAFGPEGVRREGETLVIPIGDGEPLLLTDSIDSLGQGARYSYQGRRSGLDWHLVHVQYAEGDEFLLVNVRTGEEFPLDARPVFGSDNRRLATASLDLEAGYNPNALRILGVDRDSVWVEWEIEPEDWGPSDARWQNPTALMFVRRVRSADGRYVDSAAVVSFTGEGWQIGQP